MTSKGGLTMFIPMGKITTPLFLKDEPVPPPAPPPTPKDDFWKQVVVSLGLGMLSTALTQITQIAISEVYGKIRGRGQRMEQDLSCEEEDNPQCHCPCCPHIDDTEEMTREEIDGIVNK